MHFFYLLAKVIAFADTTEIEFALKPWLVDYNTDDVQVIIDVNGIRNLKGWLFMIAFSHPSIEFRSVTSRKCYIQNILILALDPEKAL